MKKLILLLLTISALCNAQSVENSITIATYPSKSSVDLADLPDFMFKTIQTGSLIEYPQADFFGGKLDYAVYLSAANSTHWLVFYPGTGEMGTGDGTRISLLYRYGFPKLVKAGQDFPFNILMVQPNTSYSGWGKQGLPWVQMGFKPTSIITIGISLGAIEVLDELTKDTYSLLKGVVSLSGKPSGGAAAVSRMRAVPGYAYHGAKDTQVDYSTAMKFYNAYNAAHAGTEDVFTMDIDPNQGHGGWDDVMSLEPGKDQCYQWILKQFGPEPEGNTFDDGKAYILNQLKELVNSNAEK